MRSCMLLVMELIWSEPHETAKTGRRTIIVRLPVLVNLTFTMRRELELSKRSVGLCYVIDLSIIIVVYFLGFSVWRDI